MPSSENYGSFPVTEEAVGHEDVYQIKADKLDRVEGERMNMGLKSKGVFAVGLALVGTVATFGHMPKIGSGPVTDLRALPKRCMELHLGFTLTVEGLTQAVMSNPGAGDKIDELLKTNLPPTVEEVHWDNMEILADDYSGDYSYSYGGLERKLMERACETDSGDSCGMYLFDNLIEGATVMQKCGEIDQFMQEGPPDAKLAAWGKVMADQGCGVGLPDFAEICLEPEIRYHCEKVFNDFEGNPGERRLTADTFKGLSKPDQPRRLQDIPPYQVDGTINVAFDVRVTYDLCGLSTIRDPSMLDGMVTGLINDINGKSDVWVPTVETNMNAFTGADMDMYVSPVVNMGMVPKAK